MANQKLPERITLSALTKLLGVDKQTIDYHIGKANGTAPEIHRKGNLRYVDTLTILEFLRDLPTKRDSKARTAAAEILDQGVSIERTAYDDSFDNAQRLSRARVELEEAKAKMAILQLQEKQGELVSWPKVERVIREENGRLQRRLMKDVVSRLAPVIPGIETAREAREVLDAEFRSFLRGLKTD